MIQSIMFYDLKKKKINEVHAFQNVEVQSKESNITWAVAGKCVCEDEEL